MAKQEADCHKNMMMAAASGDRDTEQQLLDKAQCVLLPVLVSFFCLSTPWSFRSTTSLPMQRKPTEELVKQKPDKMERDCRKDTKYQHPVGTTKGGEWIARPEDGKAVKQVVRRTYSSQQRFEALKGQLKTLERMLQVDNAQHTFEYTESQDSMSPTLPVHQPGGRVPKGYRWCERDGGGWLRVYEDHDIPDVEQSLPCLARIPLSPRLFSGRPLPEHRGRVSYTSNNAEDLGDFHYHLNHYQNLTVPYRATRGKGKGTQVLVKWVGYDESENAWELLSNQLRDMGVKKVQQLVDQLGTDLKVKKK